MFDILNKEPIEIWTDGSSSNNKTRCAGWASILKYKNHVREHWGGFEPDTTNQQTEVYSVLYGLKEIKTTDIPIKVHSDSAYLINCMKEDWVNKKWKMNGWINSQGQPVSNKQLWIELKDVASRQLYIEWIKVKGHIDIPLNERADDLAVKGRHDIEVKLGLRDSKLENECTCKICKKTTTKNQGIFKCWDI
jgi:ribonuclease HI